MNKAQTQGSVVVIGGTSGSGRHLAEALARRGESVVITGRNLERTQAVAQQIGDGVRAIALDLTRPVEINECLASVGPVRHLVLAAVDRDTNPVRNFVIASAMNLFTLKLVGYAEVVHTLADRFTSDGSIVLFGGISRDKPYPGSTTITMANGGIATMVRTLAIELAPLRVNAIHPGTVEDSPAWGENPAVLDPMRARTPTRRLATMQDITHAVLFLLDNQAVNGINLAVDGGLRIA